jgi:hypothetical protein
MNNNTPHAGPFPLRITKNDDQFVVITNQGNHYASTFDPSAARLISAAPDLLSAVDSCLEIMIRAIGERLPIQQGTECEETDWQTAIRNARAALRKAKGEA